MDPPDIVSAARVTCGDDASPVHVMVGARYDGSAVAWVADPVLCGRCFQWGATTTVDAASACCGHSATPVPTLRIAASSGELFSASAETAARRLGAAHALGRASMSASAQARCEAVAERFVAAATETVRSVAAGEGIPYSKAEYETYAVLSNVAGRRSVPSWEWSNLTDTLLRCDGADDGDAVEVTDAGLGARARIIDLERRSAGWAVVTLAVPVSAIASAHYTFLAHPPSWLRVAVPAPPGLSASLDVARQRGHFPAAPAVEAPTQRRTVAEAAADAGYAVDAAAVWVPGGAGAWPERYAIGVDLPALPLSAPAPRRLLDLAAADAAAAHAAAVAAAHAAAWTPSFGMAL